MKLREKIKRFWTLDVHNHEGFTLVELIIVIAILAILSSVAVVGYSSYVEKANKQADLTLAAEIEQALMLAYYNGTITDGATVVVYFGDDKNVTVEGAEQAMIDAFGENYTALRLQWNGWKSEGNKDLTAEMYAHVDASNFNQDNLPDLLTAVQGLVDDLTGVIESGTVSISDKAWKDYMATNGYDITDGRTASNATTMFVASNVSDFASSAEGKAEFWDMWSSGRYSFAGTETRFSEEACRYASVMALATYVDSKIETPKYVSMLQSASGVQIIPQITAVEEAIGAEQFDLFLKYYNTTAEEEDFTKTNSQAYNDCMAFLAYMSGLDNSADSLKANTDMGAENYYADGAIQDYINAYIDTGKLILDCPDGAMAFAIYGGKVYCNPTNY